VDAGLIPTGELKSVEGTPFDFRQPTVIGAHIGADDEQIKRGGGYDHNFVVDGEPGTLRLAARVTEADSGACWKSPLPSRACSSIRATSWNGTVKGKGGVAYAKRTRLLPGDAALPGFPEPSGLPDDDLEAGRGVQVDDRVQVLSAVGLPGSDNRLKKGAPLRGRFFCVQLRSLHYWRTVPPQL